MCSSSFVEVHKEVKLIVSHWVGFNINVIRQILGAITLHIVYS